jgi:hypothetical protein
VSGVREYFLTSTSGATLSPALLAVAEVALLLAHAQRERQSHTVSALVDDPRETGQSWENSIAEIADASIRDAAPAGAKFANLPDFMGKAAWWSGQEKESSNGC